MPPTTQTISPEELAALRARVAMAEAERDAAKAMISQLVEAFPAAKAEHDKSLADKEKLRKKLTAAKLEIVDWKIDATTGLPSRKAFELGAKKIMSLAARQGWVACAIFTDIDHFKQYNDTYGHKTADKVLHDVAQKIDKSKRDYDLTGRYGGEEIVSLIVMPKENALAHAQHIAEQMRAGVEKLPGYGKDKKGVTVSIGFALFDPGTMTVSEGISRADDAMYAAKRNGRNRVYFMNQFGESEASPLNPATVSQNAAEASTPRKKQTFKSFLGLFY